jgi:hypothetical protein
LNIHRLPPHPQQQDNSAGKPFTAREEPGKYNPGRLKKITPAKENTSVPFAASNNELFRQAIMSNMKDSERKIVSIEGEVPNNTATVSFVNGRK